jgi:hypothetical protein
MTSTTTLPNPDTDSIPAVTESKPRGRRRAKPSAVRATKAALKAQARNARHKVARS